MNEAQIGHVFISMMITVNFTGFYSSNINFENPPQRIMILIYNYKKYVF